MIDLDELRRLLEGGSTGRPASIGTSHDSASVMIPIPNSPGFYELAKVLKRDGYDPLPDARLLKALWNSAPLLLAALDVAEAWKAMTQSEGTRDHEYYCATFHAACLHYVALRAGTVTP